MLSRREVLAGGVFGTGAGRPGFRENEGQGAGDREAWRGIQKAIDDLQGAVQRGFNDLPMGGGSIATLRRLFETFTRANGKFPDFCDIGMDCFYEVYDWHVKNRQQIVVTRQVDNRYTIQFMFTTLVLRTENQASFIGIPYDKA